MNAQSNALEMALKRTASLTGSTADEVLRPGGGPGHAGLSGRHPQQARRSAPAAIHQTPPPGASAPPAWTGLSALGGPGGRSFYGILKRAGEYPALKASRPLQAFAVMIGSWRELEETLELRIDDAVCEKTGYMQGPGGEGDIESRGRIENVQELPLQHPGASRGAAPEGPSLAGFRTERGPLYGPWT